MRWHFTLTQLLYNKSLASYVDSFLRTTVQKKRSVVLHCRQIGFDFTQFVDASFRHFLSDFLPMSSLMDVMVIFLVEGVKGLYRLTYAITRLNKNYIKTITSKDTFI